MFELLRLSVTRAPDATVSRLFDLAHRSPFQEELEKVVKKGGRDWKSLEDASMKFLRNATNMALLRAINEQTNPIIVELEKAGTAVADAKQKDLATVARALAANLQGQDVAGLLDKLSDLFLALMIVRADGPDHLERLILAVAPAAAPAELLRSGRPTLETLGSFIRLASLAVETATNGPPPPEAVIAKLTQTLGFPTAIFQTFKTPIQSVGVADLMLIKQHIVRYEAGEIARIENVLMGETRNHTIRHVLATEQETTSESERTIETEDELTTTDKISLRSEVDTVMKEELKTDAGTELKVGGGSYSLDIRAGVSYDQASEVSKKFASDIAKDVTQKAARRVAERTKQTERTKITESFEDIDQTSFNGTKLKNHVSGVYQWVEKVYLAQVFNYGKRMLIDVMVPEPAATLIAATRAPDARQPDPVPPGDFKISPLDISDKPKMTNGNPNPNFYGTLIAAFQVTGVEPPPPETVTISAYKNVAYEDDTEKQGGDTIKIDDGYAAQFLNVSASWLANDKSANHDPKDSYLDLTVGGLALMMKWAASLKVNSDDRQIHATLTNKALNTVNPNKPLEKRSISYVFRTNEVDAMTLNLEIVCTRTPERYAQWQLQTYEKIANRWLKLQSDYDVAIAKKREFQDTDGVLGGESMTNRQIERTELKRGALTLLSGKTLHGTSSVTLSPPTPAAPPPPPFQSVDPNIDAVATSGGFVRFCEQAFEWDKIGYVFYEYFWSRFEKWREQITRTHGDELFARFLKAGYARVVIPIRPGFEEAVNFFLLTGKPWFGGSLPRVGDPTYLPIIEEMKEALAAPGNEVPVGDPWEFRLPTQLIKLRPDDELPKWKRIPNNVPSTAEGWNFEPK